MFAYEAPTHPLCPKPVRPTFSVVVQIHLLPHEPNFPRVSAFWRSAIAEIRWRSWKTISISNAKDFCRPFQSLCFSSLHAMQTFTCPQGYPLANLQWTSNSRTAHCMAVTLVFVDLVTQDTDDLLGNMGRDIFLVACLGANRRLSKLKSIPPSCVWRIFYVLHSTT